MLYKLIKNIYIKLLIYIKKLIIKKMFNNNFKMNKQFKFHSYTRRVLNSIL